MAGGVCAPLQRISSAERRRLILYRIAKGRKEQKMRRNKKEATSVGYRKTFSLEDHKLHIEIEKIERQKKQAMNKAKEDKHMFKMSVKLPTKQGEEYFPQYGEQFRANGDVLDHGSVARIPQLMKSFHDESEISVDSNIHRHLLKEMRRSSPPASPRKRSVISSLLNYDGIIDFFTLASGDKDQEFLKSSLATRSTDKIYSDECELLKEEIKCSGISSDPDFQKLQDLLHSKEIENSETRKKKLEKLRSLLERYGHSTQNKDSCSALSVLSLLESTPGLISHEPNHSSISSEEELNKEFDEERDSCNMKCSKSVAFQDEGNMRKERYFTSREGKSSAITPRIRPITTHIEESEPSNIREAFCTSPSKRLPRHNDSPLTSYYNLSVGDPETSSAVEPGGRFSTPVSTIDSEYTRAGIYVHHGAWTDEDVNEAGLLKGGESVEELELLEQPRVLYSRASCDTGAESTRDLHSGENTLKSIENTDSPGCQTERTVRITTRDRFSTTNAYNAQTDKHADSKVITTKSGARTKAEHLRRNRRGTDVVKDAVRSKEKLDHKTTSRKTVTSIYNLSPAPSMRIIYSTRDVKPFPLRGGKASKLTSERGPRLHVSQHVSSRVQSVLVPETRDIQPTKCTVTEHALSRVESVPLSSKGDQESTISYAPSRGKNVTTPSPENKQQARNMAPGYKPSGAKSVPAAVAREKKHTEYKVRRHVPARAKSVTTAREKGLHIATGSDAGSLLVSGKRLQTRNIVSQEEHEKETRSKMEELFKSIDKLTNTQRPTRSRSDSTRSRSASTRSRCNSTRSRAGSHRSRAGSAMDNRDQTRVGLPVGHRSRKTKSDEGQYNRAKMFPVEVWSYKS